MQLWSFLSADAALGFTYTSAVKPKTQFISGRRLAAPRVALSAAEKAMTTENMENKGEKTPVGFAAVVSFVRRWYLVGFAGIAGVIALLYITESVEHLSHRLHSVLNSSSPVVAGFAGLAVGALHTFSGPDHLAGLAPLVIGQRRSTLAAFGLGALWGSGHATGQILIGLACLMVRFGLVNVGWAPAMGQVSGILVGVSLILIGLLGFNEVRNWDAEAEAEEVEKRKARFNFATYATGVLHGLSLDAIIFITPALALPRVAGAFHVLGVVFGTLVSMGGYTALLSRLAAQSPRLTAVSATAASIAVALGVIILAATFGIEVDLPGM